MSELHATLCDALKRTPIGDVLGHVNPGDVENFYMKYLHDFVNIVHKCNQKKDDEEYKVLESIVYLFPEKYHNFAVSLILTI